MKIQRKDTDTVKEQNEADADEGQDDSETDKEQNDADTE